MSFEEALYYKFMLSAGFTDSFGKWFDAVLEAQPPLSELVLEISDCPSDVNHSLSVLNVYLSRAERIEVKKVADLMMAELRSIWHEGKIEKAELIRRLFITANIASTEYKISGEPWYTMLSLDEVYDEAVNGILDMDSFNSFFDDFIEGRQVLTSSPLNSFTLYKPSLIQRVKSFFKSLIGG